MNTQISVIIPTYNAETTIDRAISSVLAQSVKPCQILIVDDASIDQTILIAEQIRSANSDQHRMDIIRLDVNSGPGRARNIGASAAIGDVLAFLDADDSWLPWHLETGLSLINQFSGDAVINQSPMLQNESILVKNLRPPQYSSLSLISLLLVQRSFCTPGLIVGRRFFLSVGGFSEARKHAEDFELFIKLRLNSERWLTILSPRSVVCGKHFFMAGRGLSAQHWQMFIGTLRAMYNGLSGTPYSVALPLLFAYHSIKYLRRMIMVFSISIKKFG